MSNLKKLITELFSEFSDLNKQPPRKNKFEMEDLEYLNDKYYLDIQTDNDGQYVIYTGLFENE